MISTIRRDREILALCPVEERFDGRGGAVATFIKETYRGLNSAMIACPAAGKEFADGLTVNPGLRAGLASHYVMVTRWLAKRLGRTPIAGPVRLTLNGRLWVLALAPLIRNAQIIHIQNRPWYAPWVKKICSDAVTVCHMHNDLSEKAPTAEQLAAIDFWIFCSDFIRKKAVQEYELDSTRCFTVYNGVSTNAGETENDDRRNAIFVGRLVEQKGVLEAIDIWEQANAEGADFELDIIGSSGSGTDSSITPYVRRVEARVAEVNARNASQVNLLGARPHGEVLKAMEKAKAFLLPCTDIEAFGLVVLEAMSTGTLPVTTRMGGIPEVTGPEWPYLLPANDLVNSGRRALADVMSMEPSQLERLASECRKRARLFDWGSICSSLESCLDVIRHEGIRENKPAK